MVHARVPAAAARKVGENSACGAQTGQQELTEMGACSGDEALQRGGAYRRAGRRGPGSRLRKCRAMSSPPARTSCCASRSRIVGGSFGKGATAILAAAICRSRDSPWILNQSADLSPVAGSAQRTQPVFKSSRIRRLSRLTSSSRIAGQLAAAGPAQVVTRHRLLSWVQGSARPDAGTAPRSAADLPAPGAHCTGSAAQLVLPRLRGGCTKHGIARVQDHMHGSATRA